MPWQLPSDLSHVKISIEEWEAGFHVGCGRSVGKDPDIAHVHHWGGGCPQWKISTLSPSLQRSSMRWPPKASSASWSLTPTSPSCLGVNNLVKFHSQQMFVCMKWIKSSVSYSSGSGSDKTKGLHLIRVLLMPQVMVEGGQLHCSAGKSWCHPAWFQNSRSERREATPSSCPPLIFIYVLCQVCILHTHARTCAHTHTDALNKEMNKWMNVKERYFFEGGEKARQHKRERAQERWGAEPELSRP